MKRTRLPDVTPGAEVITSDRASLGSVSEVGDISFKVDVPMAADYWLGRDYVIDSTPAQVTMSFMKSELNGYKLGQPGLSPEKDTTQESLSDTIVPQEQQAEQRMRMQQELAEQRRRLPHTHPEGGEDTPPDTRGGTIGEPVEAELRDAGIDPMAEEDAESRRADAPTWGGRESEQVSPAGAFVEPDSGTGEREMQSERRDAGGATPQRETLGNRERRESGIAGSPHMSGGEFTDTSRERDRFSDDMEYSIPTRGDDYDPAKMRRPILGGSLGLMAAALTAGFVIFLFMRGRRRRKHDSGLGHAARHVADAARSGVESAREAIEAKR